MSSFNKFKTNTSNKLGTQIAHSGGLSPTMATGAMNSIPIWEMLRISEEQYLAEYEYPAYVKYQASLDAEMKAIVDASGLSPFMEKE